MRRFIGLSAISEGLTILGFYLASIAYGLFYQVTRPPPSPPRTTHHYHLLPLFLHLHLHLHLPLLLFLGHPFRGPQLLTCDDVPLGSLAPHLLASSVLCESWPVPPQAGIVHAAEASSSQLLNLLLACVLFKCFGIGRASAVGSMPAKAASFVLVTMGLFLCTLEDGGRSAGRPESASASNDGASTQGGMF